MNVQAIMCRQCSEEAIYTAYTVLCKGLKPTLVSLYFVWEIEKRCSDLLKHVQTPIEIQYVFIV